MPFPITLHSLPPKRKASHRARYQAGSVQRVHRANGPDVWVFRWREDGRQRKEIIGTVSQFPKRADAIRACENKRAEINAHDEPRPRMTVSEAWGHFQTHELRDPGQARSETTIEAYLLYFRLYILPDWRNVPLEDVKAVAVEQWLRKQDDLAPATRAKIRSMMSALFSHCIRYELYDRLNPISSVRQSAKRQREPDTLSVPEIKAVLSFIQPVAIRVMMLTAASSALRRSEVRGLKWADLDFAHLWFHLRRGIVRHIETNLKTDASRKGVPMLPELAQVLSIWKTQTPYPRDKDWVFASPYTDGKWPYWPESALKDHIRPAAKQAGIQGKVIGWHTFRHSLATLLGDQGESVKTVQELLRHADSRITADVYMHGNQDTERLALTAVAGIFPQKS